MASDVPAHHAARFTKKLDALFSVYVSIDVLFCMLVVTRYLEPLYWLFDQFDRQTGRTTSIDAEVPSNITRTKIVRLWRRECIELLCRKSVLDE